MDELKSCPFCGSNAIVEKRSSGYQVRCCTCGSRGKYVVVHVTNPLSSRRKAIESWNMRASQ